MQGSKAKNADPTAPKASNVTPSPTNESGLLAPGGIADYLS